MVLKERVIYILTIVILTGVIFYSVFLPNEDYVEKYNSQIKTLERKVDSLHLRNDGLTFQIDTLNSKIQLVSRTISQKDRSIKTLKSRINEKVKNVDSFDGSELEQFFTKRYRQYQDSIN